MNTPKIIQNKNRTRSTIILILLLIQLITLLNFSTIEPSKGMTNIATPSKYIDSLGDTSEDMTVSYNDPRNTYALKDGKAIIFLVTTLSSEYADYYLQPAEYSNVYYSHVTIDIAYKGIFDSSIGEAIDLIFYEDNGISHTWKLGSTAWGTPSYNMVLQPGAYIDHVRISITNEESLGSIVDWMKFELDYFCAHYSIFQNNELPEYSYSGLEDLKPTDTLIGTIEFQDDDYYKKITTLEGSYSCSVNGGTEMASDSFSGGTIEGSGGYINIYNSLSISEDISSWGATHGDYITIDVEVSDGSDTIIDTINVGVLNQAPSITDPALISLDDGIFYPNSEIQADFDVSDPDGDNMDLFYTWKHNGNTILDSGSFEEVPSGTSAWFTIELEDYEIEMGDIISLEVTPQDCYDVAGFDPNLEGDLKSCSIEITADAPQIIINEPLDGGFYSDTPPSIDAEIEFWQEPDFVGWYLISTTYSYGDIVDWASWNEMMPEVPYTEPGIVSYLDTIEQAQWDSVPLDSGDSVNLWIKAVDTNDKKSYSFSTITKDLIDPIVSVIEPTSPYQDETPEIYLNIKEENFGEMTIYVEGTSTILWDDSMPLYAFEDDPSLEDPVFINTIKHRFGNDYGYDIMVPLDENVWEGLAGPFIDIIVDVTDIVDNRNDNTILELTKDITSPTAPTVYFDCNEIDDMYYFNRMSPDFTITYTDDRLMNPDYYYGVIMIYQADENYDILEGEGIENPIGLFYADPSTTGSEYTQTIDSTEYSIAARDGWQAEWDNIYNIVGNIETNIVLGVIGGDNAGNCDITYVNGIFDPILPEFTIIVPEISSSTPTIEFEIDDTDSIIYYQIGDDVVEVGCGVSSGTFTINVGLWNLQDEGEVSIDVWAEDPSSNILMYEDQVIMKDTIAAEIITLYDTIYFNNDPPEVTFKVQADAVSFVGQILYPDSSVHLMEPDLSDFDIVGGYYIIYVTADPAEWATNEEGEYLMHLESIDAAYNIYEYEFTFYKDITPCAILDIRSIDGPYHGTSAPLIEVNVNEAVSSITYSYDGAVWYYLNDVTPQLTQWSAQSDGQVNVQFIVYDLAENPSDIYVLHLNKDSITPLLNVEETIVGGKFGADAPELEIIALDANLYALYYYYDDDFDIRRSIQIAGTQFNDQISLGGWEDLAHGNHTITFIASDQTNEITFTAQFEKDMVGPTIEIIYPVSNTNYSNVAPIYTLQISDSDVISMWYVIDDGNEVSFTELTGALDQLEWEDPPSNVTTIVFYAMDDMGNIGSVSIELLRLDYGQRKDTISGGLTDWPPIMSIGFVVVMLGVSFGIYGYYKPKIQHPSLVKEVRQ